MKKVYITPEAEYVSFYTEEEITALDLHFYAMEGEGDDRISGDYEIVDGEQGWT